MSPAAIFELPDPALAAYTWLHQAEHAPASQPPLLWDQPAPPGKTPREGDGPPASIVVNGYGYRRADAQSTFDPPADDDAAALARWREEWLPQIEAVLAELERFAPGAVEPGQWETVLWEQDRALQRMFMGVHGTVVMPANVAAERFLVTYRERFGAQRDTDALALLQGFPNLSSARTGAIWDLSRLVRGEPALQEALDSVTYLGDLGSSPAATAFRADFTCFLTDFGYTTAEEMVDRPTWAEDPSVPLGIIRSFARQGDERSPRAAEARQRARRLVLEAELRDATATDEAAAALVSQLEAAQHLVSVKEDHNLLADQRQGAATRARWLRVGEHLRTRGAVASAEDIFFYRRAELLATLEGWQPLRRAEVEQRRARQAAYRAAVPPLFLGRPVEGAEAPRPRRLLRGTPASAGRYRGRARVINALEDADRLMAGDILVSPTTTPPWSPYFGLVGAVVTDTGGALSHGAIVAREHGIPAVVGARGATGTIPDGATVTVDGASGIVTIEGV